MFKKTEGGGEILHTHFYTKQKPKAMGICGNM